MKIGLFFGSYNPIHIGHLVIADFILEFSDLDEIWFVVSPQNPFKSIDELAADEHRLNMTRLAIPEKNTRMKVCDVEMGMPRPSYTIDTPRRLEQESPGCTFVILLGSDNIAGIHDWKESAALINGWDFYVYPREGSFNPKNLPSGRFTLIDAPVIGISSTQIRHLIAHGVDASGYVPDDVWDYIIKNKIYGYGTTLTANADK